MHCFTIKQLSDFLDREIAAGRGDEEVRPYFRTENGMVQGGLVVGAFPHAWLAVEFLDPPIDDRFTEDDAKEEV